MVDALLMFLGILPERRRCSCLLRWRSFRGERGFWIGGASRETFIEKRLGPLRRTRLSRVAATRRRWSLPAWQSDSEIRLGVVPHSKPRSLRLPLVGIGRSCIEAIQHATSRPGAWP